MCLYQEQCPLKLSNFYALSRYLNAIPHMIDTNNINHYVKSTTNINFGAEVMKKLDP